MERHFQEMFAGGLERFSSDPDSCRQTINFVQLKFDTLREKVHNGTAQGHVQYVVCTWQTEANLVTKGEDN